jgi:hypothetical protein
LAKVACGAFADISFVRGDQKRGFGRLLGARLEASTSPTSASLHAMPMRITVA